MKILIAGDFCPQNRVAEILEKGDYVSVLGEVKDIISDADYAIVNFECPVTRGGERPIEKCGPNLQCSEKGIEAVKWVGFDCVTLANNHFLDYGKEGVIHTFEACKKYSVDTVGGGMNLQEASKILYKEIKDKTLAIVNCCEHEFSIATEESAGSNPLNPIQQYYDIQKARKEATYVVVIVHGGHEHYQLPSLRMQDTYRFFIDAGADAVINHHQHCYSGYEIYKGKPIFYGIGNFCFDFPTFARKNPNWAYGYMVDLDIDGDDVKFNLHPYKQSTEVPEVKMIANNPFAGHIDELNSIISNRKILRQAQVEYYESEGPQALSVFQPFRSRLAFAARRFKLMPSLMSNKWRLALYNYIVCEAHFDKVKFFLQNTQKQKQ